MAEKPASSTLNSLKVEMHQAEKFDKVLWEASEDSKNSRDEASREFPANKLNGLEGMEPKTINIIHHLVLFKLFHFSFTSNIARAPLLHSQ